MDTSKSRAKKIRQGMPTQLTQSKLSKVMFINVTMLEYLLKPPQNPTTL
jgi:hypothetical protein